METIALGQGQQTTIRYVVSDKGGNGSLSESRKPGAGPLSPLLRVDKIDVAVVDRGNLRWKPYTETALFSDQKPLLHRPLF